jgi:hypothetical protein
MNPAAAYLTLVAANDVNHKRHWRQSASPNYSFDVQLGRRRQRARPRDDLGQAVSVGNIIQVVFSIKLEAKFYYDEATTRIKRAAERFGGR